MATPMENVPIGTFINTPQPDFNANQAISGPLSSQPHWSLKRFLRGQPKALGVVQIMIGFTQVIIWVSLHEVQLFLWMTCTTWLFFIISGSCSIAAENKLTRQRVKCSLGWNIVSCCIAVYEICIAITEELIITSPRFRTPYTYTGGTNTYTGETNTYTGGSNTYRGGSNMYTGGTNTYTGRTNAYTGRTNPELMYELRLVGRYFLKFLILLEFCIALSTSVFGCKSLCFDPSENPVASPMEEIPAPVSDPPYEVLTSRPQDYATLQLP